MENKFKHFKEKVKTATDVALIDSLIEHTQKMMDDMNYYEAVKIIKAEIINRLKNK